ncbi:alanyl-tRNA synthetase [Weissella confusa]|uniref:alanyl-tRNA synthetase n=1 Tax=Weissella confusa TaxID=1583 RepID=UPI001C6F72CD|nr:alanyl-tRNA synthetase [Weissella confusa]QYU58820.1 alanyl-tRNA synthetase [Weissella confusa]
MSKIFSKQALPYWIIALLVVIIGIMLGSGAILNSVKVNTSGNGVTKSQAARQNTSSSTSSTTKKYVEGKDYKITYTNDGVIDRAKLDKGLKGTSFITDYDWLMDTNKDTGANMAKIEVYYDEDNDMLIARCFENGSDEVNTVGFNYKTNAMEDNNIYGNMYHGKPLVYQWERITK